MKPAGIVNTDILSLPVEELMDKFGSLTLEERPTSSSSKASEEAPEVPLEETLVINKRGRAYLKNVSIGQPDGTGSLPKSICSVHNVRLF